MSYDKAKDRRLDIARRGKPRNLGLMALAVVALVAGW